MMRVGKSGLNVGSVKNTLKKMMSNFSLKGSTGTDNTNKCRVSTQGQYQVFGHEDFLRKRPYSTTCICIGDGCLFAIKGSDFERHVKSISEDTWNEIIKTCIVKENKINKLILVRQCIFTKFILGEENNS